MGNSTGNADKKATETGKNDKTKEKRWNRSGKKKEKVTQEKNNNTNRVNKPEKAGERRKIKKISRKDKTIQTKQNIPKQQKKIQPTSRRRWHENIPITGCKRNRTILE